MASSEARPLRTFLLSLLVFLALDAAAFRSGLYAHIVSPESTSGKFYWSIHYEQRRPSDPARDVLVLGNSKIERGLSVRQIEQEHLADGLHVIVGANPDAQMKWWYYQLRNIDPRQDRYRAIVIPVNGYLVRPEAETVKPFADYKSALAIAPFLSPKEWPDFLATFEDTATHAKAVLLTLFSARDYSADIADLFARPARRITKLNERAAIASRWLYDSDGIGAENIEQLRLDYASGRVTQWPAHFDPEQHTETLMYARPSPSTQISTQQMLRYYSIWLGKIIGVYRGSHTAIILLPMPAYGVPMASVDPIKGAPDIRSLLPRNDSQVIALDEQPFARLQQPALFYDVLHLNNQGRAAFTRLFTQQLNAALKPKS